MKDLKILFSILIVFTFINTSNAQYVSGNSYYGANNYIEYIAGDMPIIFVAPHAGELEPANLPDINTRGPDNGTMELAFFMVDSLHFKTGGCRPHMIINHLKACKLNPVFSESDSIIAAGTHPEALQALNEFHNFIQIAYDQVTANWGKGHYFELHGNATTEEWNMIGLGLSKTYLNMPDSNIMTRVNHSTIKNLCTVGGADFLEVLKGPTSLGGMLDSLGWKSCTSPAYPSPPDSVTFFYAGQNTWRYGSRSSGTIDATHLESYWKFMVIPANRSKYSNDLADVIIDFMNIYYDFNFNCQGQGVNEAVNNSSSLKIYPNPIYPYDLLKIETQNTINEVLILNSNAQICRKSIGNGDININDLAPGIYTLSIKMGSKKIKHHKLIIQ